MDACVRFRLPDGRIIEARPGDLVGRLASAAVRINDPRISEAHAIVSLRARTLRLLALRGRFGVDGITCAEVELEVGLVIQLAPGLALTVVVISLPDSVLGLEGPGIPTMVLSPVTSLRSGPTPELLPGFSADAEALIWNGGDGYHLRVQNQDTRPVAAGSSFVLGAHTLHFVAVPIDVAAVAATERDQALDAPLTLVLRYDTVHVLRGPTTLAIDGVPARFLTELALFGVPVEWRTLARLVWPGEDEDTSLRARFDRALARLRRRLVELGLRKDLVRTDGNGRVELLLGPRDRVRDDS